MKFDEGNLVRVSRRVHEPCGSWFPGDGDCCIAVCDSLTGHEGEPVMANLRKEDVKPHPPNRRGKRWMVGDVRLFGSIRHEEFHESKLRIQRAWRKNKWSVIEKVDQNKQYTKTLTKSKPELAGHLGKGSRLSKRQNLKGFEDEHNIVRRCLPARMANRGNTFGHKRYSVDFLSGNRGYDKPVARNLAWSTEIDDVFFQKVRADRKFREGSSEMDECLAKETTDWLRSSSKPLSSEDKDRCSIASCSSNSFCEFPAHDCNISLANLADNSDAESSFPSSSVNISSDPYFEQKLEADVHELEFHAYRSTVRALYASGPLSWEQESLLTNLRLTLHISDEEHLLQLKHLLSTQLL